MHTVPKIAFLFQEAIMFKVSMNELISVLKDFHTLTKFLIVVFDSERHTVVSYPDQMCDFCKEVRKSPALAKKCIACDNMGFDVCDKSGKPFIYKCHMSVSEAISPIRVNDTLVGYLMFGQILGNDHGTVREKAREVNFQHGLSITDAMIESMTVASDETVASAVNMMTMCANYLYTNEIIKNNPNIFVYQLQSYIESHLDGDITLDSITKHFYISRTNLYHISKENFGMGISDYIRLKRIKEAKRLLRNTNYSVSVIASKVGIQDTNYFIRIFKRIEGTTPLKYRKAHSFV